jgi:tripartite ATP-independent transporter DctM subunit
MIELSPETATIIFVIAILGSVATGYPIAFALGGVGFIIGILTLGPSVTPALIYGRVYSLIHGYHLLAVPLFIFMGIVLERSGITNRVYDALYLWLAGLRGGLALGTVLFGTILAACLGIIGASVTMLTIVGLREMVSRGYSKSLAAGSVCAGGTLGILIPPSIMLVVYGPTSGISVGKLFMAAFFPGLLLSALYCGYILIRSLIQPRIAPAIAPEHRRASLWLKTKLLFTALIPPVVLILAVLGSIFFGIAPPTEAAAVGGVAVIILAIVYRKFNLEMLKHSALQTLTVTSFVLVIGALVFSMVGIFVRLGCGDVIRELILSAPFGRWGAFSVVMIAVIILGMFIDWIGIVFIIVPIVTPLAPALGFDELWFAMMICVNLQASFLTPPFASAIFFCRGTVPPDLGVTTADIIRGVIPFILCIITALVILSFNPQIITWLPNQMIKPW